MELKIYNNETNKIIYTNKNIIELLELYNINKTPRNLRNYSKPKYYSIYSRKII